MTIHTCDKCSATIEQESLQVGVGLSRVELCRSCGEPLLVFLKDANLLQDQLRRYGLIDSAKTEANKPASLTDIRAKASAPMKPETPPLKDASSFYETRDARL
ncbi:MAG TPA: hypothetical protein VFV38_28735 [Ktedonobacteraceae bacterium]|nr:hypothetical protein [Ktedonobacteraceae bacterium]